MSLGLNVQKPGQLLQTVTGDPTVNSRLSLASLIALAVTFAIPCLGVPGATGYAAPKKGKQAGAPARVAAPIQTPLAEDDPLRTAWRIDVDPFAALGSGRPGNAAVDFDKPDGLAFTPSGLLLATDAKNRRVQVWDVKTGTRIGEFGRKVFGGEIVDIAVAPSGLVLVTDQTLNLAYAFAPPQPGAVDKETGKPAGPADYQFKGTRFGEQGFDKLGGIAIDSRNRAYCVDAHLNEVRRFHPDGTPDDSFHFEKARPNGDTYLHGCEGIAIDEDTGSLYVSSEKDSVVQVFDWETGAYKRRLLGAASDGTGTPSGQNIFSGSVEGLTIARGHLFAVDEAAGRIQIFDLSKPAAFNADLLTFSVPRQNKLAGYLGFFGHSSRGHFEDKPNLDPQRQAKEASIIPGLANPPGYFCSPDSISSSTDSASGETYIAIADQCNFRLVVYKWSDVLRAASGSATTAPATQAPGGKKGKQKP